MLLPAPVPSAMTAMARIRISARPYPVHCSQCHVAVAATGGLPSTTKKERSANRYQFVNAVEEMIRIADSEKRQGLAHTIDAYHGDCPEESNWAASGQVPALLHNLMLSIDTGAFRTDGAMNEINADIRVSGPNGPTFLPNQLIPA
jgi:hypothetical protein